MIRYNFANFIFHRHQNEDWCLIQHLASSETYISSFFTKVFWTHLFSWIHQLQLHMNMIWKVDALLFSAKDERTTLRQVGEAGHDLTKDLTLHTATLTREGSYQAGTSLGGAKGWHRIPGSPENATNEVPEGEKREKKSQKMIWSNKGWKLLYHREEKQHSGPRNSEFQIWWTQRDLN